MVVDIPSKINGLETSNAHVLKVHYSHHKQSRIKTTKVATIEQLPTTCAYLELG
jgi:hypothetical protein